MDPLDSLRGDVEAEPMGTGDHSCISPAGPFLSPGAFTRHRPSWRSTGDSHSLALGSLRLRCGRFRPRREPTSACSPSRVLTGWSRALGCLPRPSGAPTSSLRGPRTRPHRKLHPLLATPQAITLGRDFSVCVGAHTAVHTLGQALCAVFGAVCEPGSAHICTWSLVTLTAFPAKGLSHDALLEPLASTCAGGRLGALPSS